MYILVHKVVKQRSKQTLRDLVCKKAVSYQDVVSHVPSVIFHREPQKKCLSPTLCLNKIKVVKGVSCVSQCLSAPSVPNVPHVAIEISVGGRLQSFWQVWQRLGSNPRVVSILKEGYTLPFRERPPQPLSLDSKQICQPTQEQVAFRSSVLPPTTASSGKGGCQVFSGFLQPSLSGSKAQQELATNLAPEPTQSFPGNRDFQNGVPGDHKTVPPKRGMGRFAGFQQCVLPHSYSSEVQKIPKVSSEQAHLPVHLSPFWLGNGPVGIHQSCQGSETYGSSQGYKDPPVPRRMVVQSPVPGNLPTIPGPSWTFATSWIG